MRDVLVSPLGEATEFLPLKVIAPEMVADIHELLTPIFEDYHSVMVSGLHTVEMISKKSGAMIKREARDWQNTSSVTRFCYKSRFFPLSG